MALRRYDDALLVTEADPLVAHVMSSATDELRGRAGEFASYIAGRIHTSGPIRVTKDYGMFVATR